MSFVGGAVGGATYWVENMGDVFKVDQGLGRPGRSAVYVQRRELLAAIEWQRAAQAGAGVVRRVRAWYAST